VNRSSNIALTALSLVALGAAMSGYVAPPTAVADEGVAAHLFQVCILALVPLGFLFVASAEWAEPRAYLLRLTLPTVITGVAFAALYYLEHVYAPIR